MEIKGIEKINKPEIPTIIDLKEGDVFTFLSGDYANEIIMLTDGDYAIKLEDGYSFEVSYYYNTPIKKLNCHLVIEG